MKTLQEVWLDAHAAALFYSRPSDQALEAVRAHILANDLEVVRLREALSEAILHMENDEDTESFDDGLYRRVCAALQNKSEGAS